MSFQILIEAESMFFLINPLTLILLMGFVRR